MQTRESSIHGARFVSALGQTTGVRSGLVDKVGNPHHDAQGRFSAAEEAVISVFANVPEGDLRQRDEDFIHEAEKVGLVGKRGYFLNYVPKVKWTGKEPEEWTKLNREIGGLEGRANANIKKSEDKTKTPEEQRWSLSRAAVHRAAAIQLAKQRDKIPVEKSLSLSKVKIPSVLAEELASAEAAFGWSAEEEYRIDPAKVKQFKIDAIRSAVDFGLITSEDGKELIAEMKEE